MDPRTSLLIDLAQFALDLAGIIDPSGIADASSAGLSLLRGRFLDAGISLLGVVPYIGDVAKLGKIPHYLKSIRRACQVGLEDIQFGRKVMDSLPAVQDLLRKLQSIPLPEAARMQLFEIETEISRFLKSYPKMVVSKVKIPFLQPVGLIASARLVDVTQHQITNELKRFGLREAHGGHFISQLIERGPKRSIQSLGDFARQFNSGIRQLGKESGTVEVLLVASNAKVVLNLDGHLITFVIGDIADFIRR